MTIGMNNLGKNGRLGNQMFQYAALVGIAKNSLGRPLVEVAHQAAHEDVGADVLDVVVGLPGIRDVIEHQEDAGEREQQEHEGRQAPQAHRVAEPDGAPAHLHRVQVQKHAAEH